MSSQSNLFLLRLGAPPFSHLHDPPSISPTPHAWICVRYDKRVNYQSRLRCNAISKPRTQEYKELFQTGLPVIKWHEIVDDDTQEEVIEISNASSEFKDHIDSIRAVLGSMEDGEISVSAYDTAWVALIKDISKAGVPQFPSSLQWIANHQLPDGSWGDAVIFSAHDRILNTLACVVALHSWNVHPEKLKRGMAFIRSNMSKLEKENPEHMPIGFEVAFPSLLEMARTLEIDIPDDSPFLQEINARRDLKLTKIPKEILHIMPTTLLHSLEGMGGLDWEKLLKLKCADGSFLFSPSSTAYAVMQTKDGNCLNYLKNAVQRFDGGVPNVYPVDLFEHMWAIDRLQRLGISQHFQAEIKNCLDYIYRYWTEKGICWARNSHVQDIDDTAMGFRLLRLHGYDVSADVFEHFKKAEEFVCFPGQSTQAVTGMYNLYRASQVQFPGETVLEEAKKFSSKFLRKKQACGQLLDKWIIMKDLPGEVGYALDIPWNGSLPRVETRFYIEQYGGADDVWIGKTLYRMPYVNNDTYLELAKLDYNRCQTLHQLEWDNAQKWYEEGNLGDFEISRRALLFCYFLAAANIFEPERSEERLAWAKTSIMVETIMSYFESNQSLSEQRSRFIEQFKKSKSSRDHIQINGSLDPNETELLASLLKTLNQLSLDALVAHGKDIRHYLWKAWENWLVTMHDEGEMYSREGELLVQTIILGGGRWKPEELTSLVCHPKYVSLCSLTNRVCHQLRHFQKHRTQENCSSNLNNEKCMSTLQIELNMQELVHLALQNSPEDIDAEIKQTFLMVVRSFYYASYCNPTTINFHISKVLFERLD